MTLAIDQHEDSDRQESSTLQGPAGLDPRYTAAAHGTLESDKTT